MRNGVSETLQFFGTLAKLRDIAACNYKMPGSAGVIVKRSATPGHQPAVVALGERIFLAFHVGLSRPQKIPSRFLVFQVIPQVMASDFVERITGHPFP